MSQLLINCCFSGEVLLAKATGTLFAMGRSAKVKSLSTIRENGKNLADVDDAKKVMRLATIEGFTL